MHNTKGETLAEKNAISLILCSVQNDVLRFSSASVCFQNVLKFWAFVSLIHRSAEGRGLGG